MLIGQYGCGYKHSHLLAVGTCLEGRTHCYLRLTEAHIATHEAVHGLRALHVGLHVLRGLLLVGRILIEETGLQLVLHVAVGAVGKAFLVLTTAVELDEVAGYILDVGLCALLHALPCTSAQCAHAGRLAVSATVLRHLVERMDRDEDHIVILIDDLDDLLPSVTIGDAQQAAKASHTVVNVHHVVAHLELLQLLERQSDPAVACAVAAQGVSMEAVKYLMVGETAQVEVIIHEARVQGAIYGREANAELSVVEYGLQAVGLAWIVGENVYVIVALLIVKEGLEQ